MQTDKQNVVVTTTKDQRISFLALMQIAHFVGIHLNRYYRGESGQHKGQQIYIN